MLRGIVALFINNLLPRPCTWHHPPAIEMLAYLHYPMKRHLRYRLTMPAVGMAG